MSNEEHRPDAEAAFDTDPLLRERVELLSENRRFLLGEFRDSDDEDGSGAMKVINEALAEVPALLRAERERRVPVKAIREADLLQALADDQLKTIHDDGTVSDGADDPEMRQRFEELQFGEGANPVYGPWVDIGKGDPKLPSTYGPVMLIFTEEVQGRTTITAGDSLIDNWRGVIPNSQYAGHPAGWRAFGLSPGEFGQLAPLLAEGTYFEVQIHGDLTFDDVADVVFRQRPDDHVVAALKERGVRWNTGDRKSRNEGAWAQPDGGSRGDPRLHLRLGRLARGV